jgi:Zn-dependent peptidase ImmA (M78 family)/transcriptional regulator with XRE-family HTH domain
VTTFEQHLERTDPKRLGERLQLARKAKGFTQESVAVEIGVARTTLVAIEKGERRVTTAELSQLAERYDKDVFDFLNPHAPNGDLTVQFRSLIQKRLFPTEEGNHLDAATQALQLCAERMVELEAIAGVTPITRYPRPRNVAALTDGLELEADAAAEEERQRLGLGDGPISDLRATLEEQVGVRVFALKMHHNISGLFGYVSELGACVGVNEAHRPERQAMSLAHEYGHITDQLERTDVVVDHGGARKSDAERFAELFATRFLMPASGVKRHLRTHLQAQGGGNRLGPRDLVVLAHGFNVSFEAYVKRLEELRILQPGYHARLIADGFRPDEAKDILGLPRHLADTRKYPRRHELLALETYQRGLLSVDALARFLERDIVRTQERVEAYAKEFSATGDQDQNAWAVAVRLQ